MVKFDYYAIYIETSERDGEIVDIFNTFEECMKERMKYANWYRPKGNIWIYHINNGNNFLPSEEWYINEDGKIQNHYSWK